MSKLTHERLLALLHYDPATGVFTRRVAVGNRKAGEVAGGIDKEERYVRIGIDGTRYWAHRVAWFYVHGVWPEHDIDHKDRVRDHNWIDNLRPATRAINLQNQVEATPRSKSGVRGVHWDEFRGKWKAELSVGNRNRFIGRYDDIESAKLARDAARLRLHPGAIA